MTSPDYIISILVLLALGAAVVISRREGQRNPEGTGKLSKDVSYLKVKVGQLEEDMHGMATTKDIETLRAEVLGYQRTVETRFEGDRKLNKLTHESVKRIETFLIEKGLGGR